MPEKLRAEFERIKSNHREELWQQANDELWKEISESKYADQIPAIFEHGWGDIDESFLGFNLTYKYLADLIPEDRTVYDFGCSYGFQAWYFRNHKKYIGIDSRPRPYFETDNSEYHHNTIDNYIAYVKPDKDSFAICNYVPFRYGCGIDDIKRVFRDCYIFYP